MRQRHKDWLVKIEGDGNNVLSVRAQHKSFGTEEGAWKYIERMKKRYPDEPLKYYIAHLEEANVRKLSLKLSTTTGPDGLDF